MRHQEINNSTIQIPIGRKGNARVSAPAILYHSLRGRGLNVDGSIKGYSLSKKEIELQQMFPDVSTDGYVWLSLSPYSRDAMKIDARKLNPNNLRYTGQSEGFIIHKGSIPADAIILDQELDETLNLFNLHSDPKKLANFKDAEQIPALVWERLSDQYDEMEFSEGKEVYGEYEDLWARDPEYAYMYAVHILRDRFPKGEPAIASVPKYAIQYAEKFIKQRWPEAEPALLKSSNTAVDYATYVLRSRWPEAEPIILTDPLAACDYAKMIIKGRWPEAEPIIATHSEASLDYAMDVIGNRWPPGEPAILKKAGCVMIYLEEVVKGPWPAAEPIIFTDPMKAYKYVSTYIKKRYPPAEPILATNFRAGYYYAKNVLHARFPPVEKEICQNPRSILEYAKEVVQGPWATGERALVALANTNARTVVGSVIIEYVSEVKKAPWLEGEKALLKILSDQRQPSSQSTTRRDIAWYAEYLLGLDRERDEYSYNSTYQYRAIQLLAQRTNTPLTESLNLFDLHSDPSKLTGNEDDIPELAWHKYGDIDLNKVDVMSAEQLANYYDNLRKREHIWIKDPKTAEAYAEKMIMNRWPEAEPIIATDPTASYRYAINTLGRKRFPAGEPAIAKDAWAACNYAAFVIKGRWRPGEAAIASISYWAVQYATQVLKAPFPAGEKAILTDPFDAITYCREIKGEWPEAEGIISTDSDSAFLYCAEILGIGLPYDKAKKYLRKRIADRNGKKLKETMNLYNLHSDPDKLNHKEEEVPEFLYRKLYNEVDGNKEELKKALTKYKHVWVKDPGTAYNYAIVMGKRFPEGESIIATDPNTAFYYALFVLRNRWPEAESTIITDPPTAKVYVTRVLKHKLKASYDNDAEEAEALEYLKSIMQNPVTETMNLYNLHNDPKSLPGYEEVTNKHPTFMWDKLWREHNFKEIENKKDVWATDPVTAYKFAKFTNKPFPEGEEGIAKSNHNIYYYALRQLKGRFPLGELRMALNLNPDPTGFNIVYAGLYCQEVLDVDVKKYIKDHEQISFDGIQYLKDLLKREGTLTEGMDLFSLHSDPEKLQNYEKSEQIPHIMWDKIFKKHQSEIGKMFDAHWRKNYDLNVPEMIDKWAVVKKEMAKYEHLWAQNPEYSYLYALYILHAPFPMGEPIIAQDAYWSRIYAANILKGKRFPAGEEAILNDRVIDSKIQIHLPGISALDYLDIIGVDTEKELRKLGNRNIDEKWDKYRLARRYLKNLMRKPVTEAMDLFGLHSDPEKLQNFKEAEKVPELVWDRLQRIRYKTVNEKKLAFKKYEHLWAQNKNYAWEYAYYIKQKPFPAGEPIMATDSEIAYKYATEVLHGRFPLAEPIIGASEDAGGYAKHVINGRWAPAEKTLLNSNNLYDLVWYAVDVVKGRWREAEAKIASRPYSAYIYAFQVIEGRWPKGETSIAKSAEFSYAYAKNVIKDRWPPGEQALLSEYEAHEDTTSIYNYVKEVLHQYPGTARTAYEYLSDLRNVEQGKERKYFSRPGRMTEALNLFDLHNDPNKLEKFDQADAIPSIAWEKYEGYPKELKKRESLWATDPDTALKYAKAIGKRFPAGEEIIKTNPYCANKYAQRVLGRRWIEAEPIIATNWLQASTYVQNFWPSLWQEMDYRTNSPLDWEMDFLKIEYNKVMSSRRERERYGIKEDVKFDNDVGLGQTPNNASIDYFGTTVYMKPSVFLNIAGKLPRDQATSVDFIKGIIKSGKPISNPTFYVYVPDEWRDGNFIGIPRIYMHEGRNRMYAIKELEGDVSVPVHIFLRSAHKEWKAAHITPELLQALNKQIERESEGGGILQGPWFTTNV